MYNRKENEVKPLSGIKVELTPKQKQEIKEAFVALMSMVRVT